MTRTYDYARDRNKGQTMEVAKRMHAFYTGEKFRKAMLADHISYERCGDAHRQKKGIDLVAHCTRFKKQGDLDFDAISAPFDGCVYGEPSKFIQKEKDPRIECQYSFNIEEKIHLRSGEGFEDFCIEIHHIHNDGTTRPGWLKKPCVGDTYTDSFGETLVGTQETQLLAYCFMNHSSGKSPIYLFRFRDMQSRLRKPEVSNLIYRNNYVRYANNTNYTTVFWAIPTRLFLSIVDPICIDSLNLDPRSPVPSLGPIT